MDKPRGVHVRLPDGSEDVYEDERFTLSERSRILHDYAISAKGFLVVSMNIADPDPKKPVQRLRVAVYAPGGWLQARSRVRRVAEEPTLDI
jgi:hypothetical protein